MIEIIFKLADGRERIVTTPPTGSLMTAATKNGIPGIDAECGGNCACATCHIYVDDAWRERIGGAREMEDILLDMALERGPASRLSCQIALSPALDGLVIRVPARQR